MPEITLADYTGYILLEITKAREMADAYSREVAERYKQDKVLQHFSTPRFKIPKMELTVPVLISGARYRQVLDFTMPEPDFQNLLTAKVNDVVRVVKLSTASTSVGMVTAPIRLDVFTPVLINTGGIATRASGARPAPNETLGQLYAAFFTALSDNEDLRYPESLIELHWRNIFFKALETAGLTEAYKPSNPKNELFLSTLASLTSGLKAGITISRTTITNLLVNPETNTVKNGSTDSSVFVLKAEVLEEGFFIRSIRDDNTGEDRQIVEYE